MSKTAECLRRAWAWVNPARILDSVLYPRRPLPAVARETDSVRNDLVAFLSERLHATASDEGRRSEPMLKAARKANHERSDIE
jgi:hypothetical protein